MRTHDAVKRSSLRDSPLRPEALGDPAPLRAALLAAGYTPSSVAEILKPLGPRQAADIAIVRRRAGVETPLHVLVRLFMLGERIAEDSLSLALPTGVEPLVAAGLLERGAAGVRAIAKLQPFEDWYLAADFGPDVTGCRTPSDHVLGVGAASLTLARLTVRRRCAATLDLGTGAGVQALFAAAHSARVVGTDVNRRALAFAAFNVRLNGIANVDLRCGSFFDPVEGQRFDLVVSNPPYVISPASKFVYRNGGLEGDGVSETVVRAAPASLTDGGFAVILANWRWDEGVDWDARPRQWVKDAGCDAWILGFDEGDPLTYAAQWLKAEEAGMAELEAELDDWLRYYEHAGIRRICAGAVILRRVFGRPGWVRADRVAGSGPAGEGGEQIARIFDAETFLLTQPDDSQLLSHPFLTCPDVRLDHSLKIVDGAWTLDRSSLYQTKGLALAGAIDAYGMSLLAMCDGRQPLRVVLDLLCQRTNRDPRALAPALVGVVRSLLRSGVLIPA